MEEFLSPKPVPLHGGGNGWFAVAEGFPWIVAMGGCCCVAEARQFHMPAF